MNISVEQLPEKGYVLKQKLEYGDLVTFIREVYEEPNIVTRVFNFINFTNLFFCITFIFEHFSSNATFGALLAKLSWAVLITVLLVPLHEAIHGIAYKLAGAPKVSFSADFKQFIFSAQADKFVVGARSFYAIAFAPFVIVTSAAIMGIIMYPEYKLILSTGILIHTMACGGDFGLAAYFYKHADSGMVTYDDVDANESFFWVKKKKKKSIDDQETEE